MNAPNRPAAQRILRELLNELSAMSNYEVDLLLREPEDPDRAAIVERLTERLAGILAFEAYRADVLDPRD